ncbi:polynucleotide adenylyltransferase PcnB [Kiritimatiellota bacterium B12222]|nr:polynucleotide adenylyltransferase PcnB [Kiritimatiellota bacterium B12222]
MEPTILQRSDHCISRNNISKNALTVLYRLNEKGYKAYLAGGCVRDLMLGRQPKDFDVATDASPQEVKRCFRNCRLIGRRFRLAHVMFRDEIIEVATFRAPTSGTLPDPVEGEDSETEEVSQLSSSPDVVINEEGVVIRDNEYGTPQEDAFRRDFTVNALFYDIADFSIIDYVGGLEDLKKRVIHCIGDPEVRYQEDPVRMIRAVRFASTLDLRIEQKTYDAILSQTSQMLHASHARMYEEILKFFYSGAMESAFKYWNETGLLDVMFPGFTEWYREKATPEEVHWHHMALQQLDKWKAHNIKASQELAYTLFLAPYICSVQAEIMARGDLSPRNSWMEAIEQVQRILSDRILIPKRIAFKIFDLLYSQDRFTDRRNEQRTIRFLHRSYFRDALVLFKFDALASGIPQADLIAAWTADLKKAPPPSTHKDRPHKPRRRRRQRRPQH